MPAAVSKPFRSNHRPQRTQLKGRRRILYAMFTSHRNCLPQSAPQGVPPSILCGAMSDLGLPQRPMASGLTVLSACDMITSYYV